jgi:class 3 adenylate cyclase
LDETSWSPTYPYLAASFGEAMSEIPETRFAPHGDSYIAYQVLGQGPPDIVFMRSAWNHVELQWEDPRMARFLTRLASIGRLIVFDPRGSGLSDAFLDGGIPTVEDWADDALSVMNAVGSDRAAVVCCGGGATRAIPLAASHPERVISLVVCDGFARMTRAADYPFGRTEEEVRQGLSEMVATWGRTVPVEIVDGDPVLAAWAPRYRRYSTSPGFARKMLERLTSVDVRNLLSAVRVTTLVIQHAESAFVTVDHGRYLGEHIPGATYVELAGRTLLDWHFPDPDAVAAEIEGFLLGTQSAPEPDRVLATVLFTDIVASTQATAAAGDRRWHDTLDALDRFVDGEVGRFRGRVVKSTGDGHLATFDGPGRAIRCATALCARADILGLTLRAGLHTGEVEVRGDDIGGIAVSIARRVCDAAGEGCVFVSAVVPPLVAGSPIKFVDRGEHELKGVPERWRLYSVKSG